MEDLEHFLLFCTCMVEERRQVEKLTVDGWHEIEDNEEVVEVVDEACESAGIRRAAEKLYRRQ